MFGGEIIVATFVFLFWVVFFIVILPILLLRSIFRRLYWVGKKIELKREAEEIKRQKFIAPILEEQVTNIDRYKLRNILTNGKTVDIGEVKIKYKNNTLIINEESFFVKEIKEIKFNGKMDYVNNTFEYFISVILNNEQQKDYLIGKNFEQGKWNERLRLEELFNELRDYIFKSEEEKQELLQEDQQKNNLLDRKQATIGNATIQCTKYFLIINGERIFNRNIQELKISNKKTGSVWKNTLDNNLKIYDDNSSSFIDNPDCGKTISREKITLDQYYKEQDKNYWENPYPIKYSYDIDMEYYISVVFHNRQQKDYFICSSSSINYDYSKLEEFRKKIEELKTVLIFNL